MAEREHLHTCEQCGKPICRGDEYQPGGDCNFCPDHAATLGDILQFWADDLTRPENEAAWPDEFDDADEVRAHLENLRIQIEERGEGHKPLYVA